MRGKLLFITGAAVGYVLGARAGRKRYEQIKSVAVKVWESPGIQREVGQLEDYAAAKVGDIPGALYVAVRKITARKRDRTEAPPEPRASVGTAAASPAEPAASAPAPADPPAPNAE